MRRCIILEAYFHSDPRIQEWVNQITENIFTVSKLTGVDSEVEFQKGSQIVTNLTHLLQGISIFPPEYLEDGLKQLLEQQIPDSRAIYIPAFQDTMNKMLHEGMMRAIDTQNKENLKTLVSSIKDIPDNTKEDARENFGENYIKPYDENTRRSLDEVNYELVDELAITALASANCTTTMLLEAEVELQVPEQTDHLKTVLGNIFPNIPVCWNPNLMGQTFLAQVEDIIICLHDPEQPCNVENLNKEGWRVYECNSNDLMFPRRLERGIRQIQRIGSVFKQGEKG